MVQEYLFRNSEHIVMFRQNNMSLQNGNPGYLVLLLVESYSSCEVVGYMYFYCVKVHRRVIE